MNNRVSLETARLNISTLSVSDISAAYVDGLNDPEVNHYLFDVRLVHQTPQSVTAFVEANLASPTDLFLGLFLKKDNSLFGTLRILGISKIHFSCTLGICIFKKEYWKAGFGTESISAVVDYLFQELKLHYVEAGAYEENIGSIKMFQKAGFELIARYPDKFRHIREFKPVVVLRRINPYFDSALLEVF
ncbi:MAG: GNAT family N-acetyltransferase, partial [Deltaproteobacteria bacterium]|nr:GNAT family N-acetyltransferase [Deltaproteobacteria bacterium]